MRHTIVPRHCPKALAMDTIKGFFEINEVYEQRRVPLQALFHDVKIWSIHPLPLLNPACFSRNFLSSDTAMRLELHDSTLLGIGSEVIPRKLSQTVRSPFFGTLTIRPLLQSSGISSRSHTMRKRTEDAHRGVQVSFERVSWRLNFILPI